MENQHRVIAFPKKNDLIIPGELIKIEVHYNSFSVFYQSTGFNSFEHQLVICSIIFPIKFLIEFFKKNGSVKKNYFVQRPQELLEI